MNNLCICKHGILDHCIAWKRPAKTFWICNKCRIEQLKGSSHHLILMNNLEYLEFKYEQSEAVRLRA